MKLKYYLRGLGIGIIVTTLVLMVAFSGKKEKLSDQEIMQRAEQLGMVMADEGQTETGTEENTGQKRSLRQSRMYRIQKQAPKKMPMKTQKTHRNRKQSRRPKPLQSRQRRKIPQEMLWEK